MKRHFFNADCFDILPRIPAASVDMVLIDPPYGTTAAAWDVAIDWKKLFEHLWRVLKPNGACIIFSQQPVACDVICADRKNFRYEWIWEKTRAQGFLNAKKMPMRAHENILCFYRESPYFSGEPIASQKLEPYVRHGDKLQSQLYGKNAMEHYERSSSSGDRLPRSVVKMCAERTGHPTGKPVELCEMLIRQYTREGDTVLDCFAGGGSILCAAKQSGRSYIGVEKDKDFYELAKNNLRATHEFLI